MSRRRRGAAARRRAMTEPDGSVTDSESAGPGAAPAATQARWVAVARCRGARRRAPVTDSDAAESESARPDRRRESEPVFIFAQSSQRPTRSQLSDLKARGRDESRRAAAGDWAGVRRAAETGWGSWRRTVSCRMLGVHGSKRDVLEVSAGVWHVSTDTCALDT